MPDLEADPGDSLNRYDENPQIVAELETLLQSCREDLGDEATGVHGRNAHPIGRVNRAETLTTYDPNHPYIIPEYDLGD